MLTSYIYETELSVQGELIGIAILLLEVFILFLVYSYFLPYRMAWLNKINKNLILVLGIGLLSGINGIILSIQFNILISKTINFIINTEIIAMFYAFLIHQILLIGKNKTIFRKKVKDFYIISLKKISFKEKDI